MFQHKWHKYMILAWYKHTLYSMSPKKFSLDIILQRCVRYRSWVLSSYIQIVISLIACIFDSKSTSVEKIYNHLFIYGIYMIKHLCMHTIEGKFNVNSFYKKLFQLKCFEGSQKKNVPRLRIKLILFVLFVLDIY